MKLRWIILLSFVFCLKNCSLFGQKSLDVFLEGGVVLHPILCDTHIKYDSTLSIALYGNNERVSFVSKGSITWMAGGHIDYHFNKYFLMESGLCYHRLKMSSHGNPDTVLKYCSFSNNPFVSEEISVSVFSVPVGLGLSFKNVILYGEILLPINVKEVSKSTTYDGQLYESENNMKQYYKPFNIKIYYNIPITKKIQMGPFISWYNVSGKCPNNFFVVGFQCKLISKKISKR